MDDSSEKKVAGFARLKTLFGSSAQPVDHSTGPQVSENQDTATTSPEKAKAIRMIETFKRLHEYYDANSAAINRTLPHDPGKLTIDTLLKITTDEAFLIAYRNNQLGYAAKLVSDRLTETGPILIFNFEHPEHHFQFALGREREAFLSIEIETLRIVLPQERMGRQGKNWLSMFTVAASILMDHPRARRMLLEPRTSEAYNEFWSGLKLHGKYPAMRKVVEVSKGHLNSPSTSAGLLRLIRTLPTDIESQIDAAEAGEKQKAAPVQVQFTHEIPERGSQPANNGGARVSSSDVNDHRIIDRNETEPSVRSEPHMTREEYLINLDKEFQDPLKVVSFEDESPLEHMKFTVQFERLVGTMSQRELFILKHLMFNYNGELENIAPGRLDARLLIASLYGDGKGKVTFNFRENLTRGGADGYRQFYFSDMTPMSVNEAFQDTVDSFQLVLEHAPDSFLGQWVKAQLSGKSPSASSTTAGSLRDSQVFTTGSERYGLPLGRAKDGAVVSYTGNRALVTIAPPESGKSMSQAVPALLSFAGHVFVLDIKGHFFERTAEKRRQAFSSRIVNFNPLDSEAAHYNPLHFVSDHPDECWGESAILAELIVPIRNSKDASWETMAQRLLALFLAYTVMTEPAESRSMNKVLDLVAGIGTAEAMTLITTAGSQFPSAMQRAARTVLSVTDPKSHAQFMGILQALEQNLSIWNNPKVERAMDRCDWSPMDFRGDTPVSVYLTIPLESISTYGPLIRVMTAQHVFQLMRKIPPPGSTPILFLLDEFPQLGRMDPIRKAIEVGREYGIRTWLFAQFANQFEDTYGQVGKGMIDICGVRMFMNPPMKDAETISKEFGNQMSLLSEQKQPALPPDEIIGPSHRDSVFVLSTNETPLVLTKNFPAR